MIVFLDDSVFTGCPQSSFMISEDNIYERKVDINAMRGRANITAD